MVNSFWQDKRVITTGSAGFLGCWLSDGLANAGAQVIGLDIKIEPKSNFYNFNLKKKIKQLHLDIKDHDRLKSVFKKQEPEYIFHLAAQPIVTIANKNPVQTFENNIKGTWNVLEVARNCNPSPEGIIIASSDKAYGIHEKLPYTEHARLQGSYPYDVSKSCTDLIAQSYFRTFGMNIGITRSGNFYGGGDLHFDRIVPGTIKSLLHNEQPIIRSDGRFIRDYIYIKDIVNGYALLAQKIKQVKGNAFNFSTENPIDVITIVKLITSLMQKHHLQPKILNEAKSEIKAQYLSSKKARMLLEWMPRYSLERGLKETITWYETYFEKNKNKNKK